MKNFKKVLAVMTAAASLCMSATAFAATGTVESTQGLSGTFNAEKSVLDIVNGNEVLDNSETTILVLTSDIEANEDTNVTEGKIMYINQQNVTTDGKNFAGMGLKLPAGAETLGKGTYPIKVGCYDKTTGEFAIKVANLVVTDGTTPGGEKTIKIVFGDVNSGEYTGSEKKDMSKVTAADALAVLGAVDGEDPAKGGIVSIGDVVECADGKKFVFGDINGGEYTGSEKKDMSKVTAADALAILGAVDGEDPAKGGIVSVGDVIEIKVAETK